MPLPEEIIDDQEGIILDIADIVKKGECILFLGAGIHAEPPEGANFVYPKAVRPPLGGELCVRLADACAFSARFPTEAPTNLGRVALYYQTKRFRPKLIEEIRKHVHEGKIPSPVLTALARMDFKIVITTNYDQLFERALRDPQVGKDPEIRVYNPDEDLTTEDFSNTEPTAQQPYLFKIHGDIDEADSIVVTDEDYIQFVLRMSDHNNHPIPDEVRFRLPKWPTIFIGYSLWDYNLRLLFKTLRWKNDKARRKREIINYSVDHKPDPLIVEVWQNDRKYIKFLAQDVWTFVPKLYTQVTGKEMPV